MNKAEATTFTHRSQTHRMLLELEAESRECDCKPYVDWFTYNRWQAQGMQVQKGEKGIKLLTYITKEQEDKNGKVTSRTYSRNTSVFCRHQVKAIT